MKTRGILITAVVLLALVFAVTNWETLTESVPVNLLVTTAETPVGLILLLVTLFLALVFFAGALLDRAAQLQQVTHLDHQLEAARARLDQRRLEEIEALRVSMVDRLDDLQARVTERLEAIDGAGRERHAASREALGERFDAMGTHLEARVERLESALGQALEAAEERTQARLEQIDERVGRVRNEIAADVGEAEDSLKHLLEREPLRE